MNVLHGLMSRLNITTMIICRTLESHEDQAKGLPEKEDTL